VTLLCSTKYPAPPVWTYRESSLTDRQHRDLVLNGDIVNGNVKWFELERPSSSQYNLVVRAASADNTGFYTCQEDDGFAEEHHYHLNVSGRERPTTRSTKLSNSITTTMHWRTTTGDHGCRSGEYYDKGKCRSCTENCESETVVDDCLRLCLIKYKEKSDVLILVVLVLGIALPIVVLSLVIVIAFKLTMARRSKVKKEREDRRISMTSPTNTTLLSKGSDCHDDDHIHAGHRAESKEDIHMYIGDLSAHLEPVSEEDTIDSAQNA
jgi:hypothetical protein